MRLFLLSVVAGAVVTVLVLLLLPLPRHARVPSEIGALQNGGRQEAFVIRVPGDRIEIPPGRDTRLLRSGSMTLLRGARGTAAAVEAFRLRDSRDRIIGVATRLVSEAAAGGTIRQGSDWILAIPSRGTLLMSAQNRLDLLPRVKPDGHPADVSPTDDPAVWATARGLAMAASGTGAEGGSVLRGTDEFAGLTGRYTETWERDSSAPEGRAAGRITLATELQTTAPVAQ